MCKQFTLVPSVIAYSRASKKSYLQCFSYSQIYPLAKFGIELSATSVGFHLTPHSPKNFTQRVGSLLLAVRFVLLQRLTINCEPLLPTAHKLQWLFLTWAIYFINQQFPGACSGGAAAEQPSVYPLPKMAARHQEICSAWAPFLNKVSEPHYCALTLNHHLYGALRTRDWALSGGFGRGRKDWVGQGEWQVGRNENCWKFAVPIRRPNYTTFQAPEAVSS